MGNLQITLYSDAEYKGKSATFGVGRYPTSIGLGNDSVSSVRIPKGLKVTICEHGSFEGRRCILVRDTPSLGGANDKATSMIVEEDKNPCVIVYSDSEFRGWSAEVQPGAQSEVGAGNDLISSVIVPPGFRVTLYEDSAFKGRTRELTSDAPNLRDFNDETSSLIVDRLTNRAPTLAELDRIIKRVGPRIYIHPDDAYRPSSVDWFLARATLRGKDGSTRRADAGDLPSGGGDDGLYWLEADKSARGGNLDGAVAYVNAKLQNHWLDIQFWIFYPYNGAGSARVTIVDWKNSIDLSPMGQHGGDWEHITCRVDPASQELRAVYLAQHSGGEWRAQGDIPREGSRPVAFASRHGHALYGGEGSNLSNGTSAKKLGVTWFEFGLLNSTDKGTPVLDCGSRYTLLRADFLDTGITAPSWTRFMRRWGPYIKYQTSELKDSIRSSLGGIPFAGEAADAIWDAIPSEFKEENGPTGPWKKGSWNGPE